MPFGIGFVPELRVRSGAVLAERDDRGEGGPVGAGLVPGLLEPPRHLRLGPSDERLLAELAVHAVRDGCGAPQGVELALLLDRAQLLDLAGRRDDVHPAARSVSADASDRCGASTAMRRPDSSSASAVTR